MEARAEAIAFEELGEAAGIFVGQRLDEGGIDEGKDGHTGGDAKCEDDYGSGRKAGVLAKLSQGKAKILQHSFKPKTDRLVALLIKARCIAESALCRVSGFLTRHAIVDHFSFHLRAMKGHLFVQLRTETAAAE